MTLQPRVAVIGAGPSGLYAAAALAESDLPIAVDVIDRLAAPFGLVRYGVAPDHARMKSVVQVLRKPFADGSRVRFLGNVPVGSGGLTHADVAEHYTAVIHASGCSVERDLDIPGEHLDGSHGSRAFVSWYSGHPDMASLSPRLDHRSAVVVGAGNVALDVARVLARDPEEMAETDVPDPVLAALRGSAITDVHVIVRRDPEHVRFTAPELRQIGNLNGVSVVLHGAGDLGQVPPDADRRTTQNLALLRGWAAAEPVTSARRIHLHFSSTPLRIEGGTDGVTGIVVERNAVVDGHRVGTGETETIEAGLVVRAIGYWGEAIGGLPFDQSTGTIPNEGGRVVDHGAPVHGSYVTGWIKRGPSGVIGTNKEDAVETVRMLQEDLAALPVPTRLGEDLVEVLEGRGLHVVSWTDWEKLDAEEIRRGEARGGAARVKVATSEEMLAVTRPATGPGPS